MKIARYTRSVARPAKMTLVALVATCASGAASWAADVGPTATPAADAPLDEIVVTARLRSERLQDIPDTIAVISPDFMVRNQVETLKDVTLLLPNVGISESLSPGSSFINIRGINTIRNSDPAVAIILDGVQFNNVNEVSQDLNDIAQIEVLKGPQGALYGRNAIGGAVNIVTTTPTNQTEGTVEAGGGNGGTVQARGSLSGPIVTDQLFYRISAFVKNSDGFIENTEADRKTDFSQNANVRARLRWVPNDALSFDFRLSWDGLKAGTYYYIPILAADGVPLFNQARTFTFSPTSDPISVDYRNIVDTSLRTDYKMEAVTWTAVVAENHTTEHYGRPGEGIGEAIPGDLDWTPYPILANSQTWGYNAKTVDLRLSSNNSTGLRWTAGVYYFDQSRIIQLPVSIAFANYGQALTNLLANFAGTPTSLFAGLDPNDPLTPVASQNDRTHTRDYAGYGNVVMDLGPSFEAALGIRYDDNFISQDDLSYGSHRSVRYDSFQPKASLTYKIGDNDRAYATASKGFRSGGFNSIINTVATSYAPETLWNYELGIKTETQDHYVTANAAVFYEDYKNSQQFQFDGKTATQTIFNIAKSRIYGAEFDVEAKTPITGLSFQASAGIMDSKIKSTSGIPDAVTAAVGNVVGNYLPVINHWTFSVGSQFAQPLWNNWVLTPSLNLTGRGKQYWYIDNVNEAPNLYLVNSALVLDGGSRWRVALTVKNLLDRSWYSDYESQRQTGLFTDVAWPQAGRVFLGTVSYKF
jgi:iron complex outermembrane receptor protein